MGKINTSIIKNMCLYSAANYKEAFIYQYSGGKICFSDLKTLNHITNNIDRAVKVLYNAYRVKNSHYIRIINTHTGEAAGYYDITENEFFKV